MSTQPDSTNPTTAPSAAPVDVAAVADALLRIAEPGQVIEVRALEASLGKRQPGTLSGYFNDPKKLAQEVARIISALAIYITLNPLNSALLARAENRIGYAKRGGSAADGDVTVRRWLLVDLDPVRPSGVSATDAEHEAALAKANAIAAAMSEQGWPEPIVADSGNGAHQLYRIDLPRDDDGLVERCLRAFAKQFDDETVTVDLKVFNPARICRLYGTWARKGDNTADRPHRRSRILKAPAELQVVDRALLEAFAGPAPVAAPAATGRKRSSRGGTPFDLANWIRDHGLAVTGPTHWQDRDGNECERWIFDVCPFNPEHTNRSAFILRFPDGAIAAGCHHNGCSGKDWHALRDLVEPGWRAPQYLATAAGLFWIKPTPNGPAPIQLTNFSARIVADVSRDDGAETTHVFTIDAQLHGRRSQIDVPASRFAGLGWVPEALGAQGIVYPGLAAKDHARVAIQILSHDIVRRTVFTHLGWRKVGDRYVYLHAGGAIAPEAPIAPEIHIDVGTELARFTLPAPPRGDRAVAAVRASLQLLTLALDAVIIPLFAAIWRSVLRACDFTIHLSGASGTFKTELAALAQQHFGAELDARNLPGSWSSTGNSLEVLAYTAKDTLIVVDDFAPSGTAIDVAKLHREAARLIRAQGNRSGRGRLRQDATLRPAKYPRGLILSTGEDVPGGHSVRARLGVIEIEAGTIDQVVLTRCQRDAREGFYAEAMAAFLQWLAPRYGELRLSHEIASLRELACSEPGAHRRTPVMVASLFVGIRYFSRFACEIGVFDDAGAETFERRCWTALGIFAAAQATHLQASDPVQRFCELLASAMASGRAHVAGPDGEAPRAPHTEDDATPQAWGWRHQIIGIGNYAREEWRPQGDRVGWYDAAGDNLYLDIDTAVRVASAAAGSGVDGIAIAARTLVKRLKERNYLKSTDTARDKNTVQHMLEGKRRNVVHLRTSALVSGLRAQWAQRAQEPPPDPENDDPAPEMCARNPGGTGFRAQERAHSRGQEGGFAPNAPIAPIPGDETRAEHEAVAGAETDEQTAEDVSAAQAALDGRLPGLKPRNWKTWQ